MQSINDITPNRHRNGMILDHVPKIANWYDSMSRIPNFSHRIREDIMLEPTSEPTNVGGGHITTT
ncbi:hypothetical protein LCGC14_2765650, partial [marine sediment metagenome]